MVNQAHVKIRHGQYLLTPLIVYFTICTLTLVAQPSSKGNISVAILDEKKMPLENITVELLKSIDSSLTKASITDKNGIAGFENIAVGSYFIKLNPINFNSYSSTVFDLSDKQPKYQLQPIILVAREVGLTGVTVTARKLFIQKLTDRIVVNVENSIVSAGSSAMDDVLERPPGINVDQNDVISLRGRSGMIIMIDGKPTAMTGADLTNYLRGLPSAAIERIDIITNPSFATNNDHNNNGVFNINFKHT